jgi:UDP-glucose 4-epimerase
MTHYLVTGGAGFIGSHLVESLRVDGHTVRVLDDLSTGKRENLPHGAELVRADVTSPDAVRRALDGIDACFHLASIASVERSHNEWLHSHAVNLGGTITLLEEIRLAQQQVRPIPFVYASSAAVYGAPDVIPISEDAGTHPVSAYGVDKLGCELHAAVGSRIHGLNVVGLRFFNVYGPRQDPNSPYSGVITIFCRQASKGIPLEIHGDGSQVRDFIFVSDAVIALRKAMAMAAPKSQIFNVCTGVGTTIGQLAEIITQQRGLPFRPRYAPSRAGDLHASIGDARHARCGLGFSSRISLEEGLELTLASMKSRADLHTAGKQLALSEI